MKYTKNNLITILGPTACGKTAFAAQLAYQIDGEIISGDSRQVYKRMDLGTGKDISEYTVNGCSIPYHLIDIAEPGYRYNIFEYQDDFSEAFKQIQSKQKYPILCGGSGMYIESVLRDYQLLNIPPNEDFRLEYEAKELNELNEIAKNWGIENKILDPYNKKRIVRALERHKFAPENNEAKNHVPQISPLIIGINVDVPLRRERITKRLHERLELGMVDEVRSLLEEGVSSEALIYYGLEYRYITQYLLGELAYDKMVELLNIAIHQFAKRQMTWYRRMEKMGFEINWIDGMWSKKDKLIATGMYLKSFFERNE